MLQYAWLNIFIQSKVGETYAQELANALNKRLDDSSNVIRISSCIRGVIFLLDMLIFNDKSLKYNRKPFSMT